MASCVVRVAAAVLVVTGVLPGAAAVPASPFHRTGSFPALTSGTLLGTGMASVLAVDPTRRLLYQVLAPSIEIRDLDSLSVLRRVSLSGAAPSGAHLPGQLSSVDAAHHRLFVPYRTDSTSDARLAVVDGSTGAVRTIVLMSPVSGVPSGSIGIEDIDYDPTDDVVYLLWTASAYTAAGSPPVDANNGAQTFDAGVVYVQAISASSGSPLGAGGFPLRSCVKPLDVGRAFGRNGDELYVACQAIVSAFPSPDALILKIGLDANGVPREDKVTAFMSPAGAAMGTFDHVTGRMMIENGVDLMAVFDGPNEAWVGLGSVPQSPSGAFALNERVGRLYMCAPSIKKIYVSDASRQTPTAPPLLFPAGGECPGVGAADPSSLRLFVGPVPVGLVSGEWVSLQDGVEVPEALQDEDLDQGALDIPEVPGVTEAQFTAQAGAYGTRLLWAGGPRDSMKNMGASGIVESGGHVGFAPAPLSRDLRFAEVMRAKLGGSGTEARAISWNRDDRTDSDLAGLRVYSNDSFFGEVTPFKVENPTGLPTWPYLSADCNAFGSSTDVTDGEQEGAHTKCTLEPPTIDASAQSEISSHIFDGSEHLSDEQKKQLTSAIASTKSTVQSLRDALKGVATLGIGDASASVWIGRDPAKGIVARARAESHNLGLTIPGVGSIVIGDAVATVDVFSKGRPHTADSVYSASLSGVRISNGSDVYRCAEDCVPSDVADAINAILGPRVEATAPTPDAALLHGSNKGTQAVYRSDFWDQLEEVALADKPADDLTMPALRIKVNNGVLANDSITVDLAGLTASTSYRIQLAFVDAPPPPPSIGGPPAISPPQRPTVGGTRIPREPRSIVHTIEEQVKTGMRLILGLGHGAPGVIVGWGLLLSPLYVTLRRRALLSSGRGGAT